MFFDLKNVVSESQISTKHEFLKVLSSVYDPLGIVYPTIMTHKNVVSKDLYDESKLGWCTLPETIIAECQNIVKIKLEKHYSLRARDGFIQPIFLQKVWLLQFVNQIKWIKKTVVSCDVIGGITLGTTLKMPIFTLYLPHNLQSRVLVFQKFM